MALVASRTTMTRCCAATIADLMPPSDTSIRLAGAKRQGAGLTEKNGWLLKAEAVLQGRARVAVSVVLSAGFFWRLWLAQATYFNTDEAWHFFLANQPSALLAYKASLTISHPPLLILIEHFWRVLGTSNVVLRLPAVITGTIFTWVFYKWLDTVAGRAAAWVGIVLSAFLGPMITGSAEVRQTSLLLMFAICAAWGLEIALAKECTIAMWVSCACLCLALLSHYSALFLAAVWGVFGIVRILQRKPPTPVLLAWIAGEIIGVVVAGLLYKTHLGKLSALLSQPLLPQQYLYSSYFHKGSDRLLPFLYRGTFGVFRFIFGQTQIGQLAAMFFFIGVALLFLRKRSERAFGTAFGILLILPFMLSWLAAAAGQYPYGRMRQCMFLAIFALAGVSVCVSWVAKENAAVAAISAAAIVLACHAFGTLQDRDALPLSEQRQVHMDQMLEFVRSNIGANDVILTDQATSYQLRHYLCRQKPVSVEIFSGGFQRFSCEGFRVVFTGPNEGALSVQSVEARWRNSDGRLSAFNVWVVEGGWASGLGEDVQRLTSLSAVEVHSFGRYLEVFKLPDRLPRLTQG